MTEASTISLSAVTVQGAEALEEETAMSEELRIHGTVTEGETAAASTVESAIETPIEDDRPTNTATR